MKLADLTKEKLLELIDIVEHYPSVTVADDKGTILAYLEDEACQVNEETQRNFLRNEYISSLNLSYEVIGTVKKWGGNRYAYEIIFGRFQSGFMYFGSIEEHKNNNVSLDSFNLLYAYKCTISDAYSVLEAGNDKATFLINFGYIDSEHKVENHLNCESMEELETLKAGIEAWNGCKSTFRRLNKKEDELLEILDTLQDLEIE